MTKKRGVDWYQRRVVDASQAAERHDAAADVVITYLHEKIEANTRTIETIERSKAAHWATVERRRARLKAVMLERRRE